MQTGLPTRWSRWLPRGRHRACGSDVATHVHVSSDADTARYDGSAVVVLVLAVESSVPTDEPVT